MSFHLRLGSAFPMGSAEMKLWSQWRDLQIFVNTHAWLGKPRRTHPSNTLMLSVYWSGFLWKPWSLGSSSVDVFGAQPTVLHQIWIFFIIPICKLQPSWLIICRWWNYIFIPAYRWMYLSKKQPCLKDHEDLTADSLVISLGTYMTNLYWGIKWRNAEDFIKHWVWLRLLKRVWHIWCSSVKTVKLRLCIPLPLLPSDVVGHVIIFLFCVQQPAHKGCLIKLNVYQHFGSFCIMLHQIRLCRKTRRCVWCLRCVTAAVVLLQTFFFDVSKNVFSSLD